MPRTLDGVLVGRFVLSIMLEFFGRRDGSLFVLGQAIRQRHKTVQCRVSVVISLGLDHA